MEPKSVKEKLEEIRNKKKGRILTTTDDIINQVLRDTSVVIPSTSPVKERKQEAPPLLVQNNIAEIHRPLKKEKENLKFESFLGEVYISGKEKVEFYNQEIQVNLDPQSDHTTPMRPRSRTKVLDDEENTELPKMQHDARRVSSVGPGIQLENKNPNATKKEISQDEIKNIVSSISFQSFLSKSSKIIEKTLNSKEGDLLEDLLSNEQINDSSKKKSFLDPLLTFTDIQNTSNRVVMSIEWSPNIPDVLLASYSQNSESNPNDPQGVVLLWSISLRSRPEFTCFCQSQVTSAKFNPFSNSMIVGGLYSGQIVLWDLRAKSFPVLRSSMSSGAHAHPIYSLAVVGTQNSHNIISVSNDGRLCVWNTAMLSTPQKSLDLKNKFKQQTTPSTSSQSSEPVNATCITFPEDEANNFFTGCEDGSIFSCQVHANQNSNENILELYEGHQGPISSLSCFPSNQEISSDISGLLLSSSFDWSVKLWNPRLRTDYLASFESAEDYVLDVAWNQANPTMFSSVDGEGYVDLWDLSRDLEVPVYHHKCDNNAINKAKWNNDGSKLATGNSVGSIKIFEMNKSYLKPSPESLDKFESTMHGLLKKDKKDV